MLKKYLPIVLVTFVILAGIYFAFNRKGQEIKDNSQASVNQAVGQKEKPAQVKFNGTVGERAGLVSGQIKLAESLFEGTAANFYNTELPGGRTVYFFVLRDSQGVFRAAANACEVCFDSRMGFEQRGDYMVCRTCGNSYPLSKIATEKGGCNPGPISPSLEVKDGQVVIEQKDLERVVWYFN